MYETGDHIGFIERLDELGRQEYCIGVLNSGYENYPRAFEKFASARAIFQHIGDPDWFPRIFEKELGILKEGSNFYVNRYMARGWKEGDRIIRSEMDRILLKQVLSAQSESSGNSTEPRNT
jgi:hypothetical protein